MEAGSLLQEALAHRSAEQQQDVFHSDQALYLDVYLLPDNNHRNGSSTDNPEVSLQQQLLQLAQVARDANDFFQRANIKANYDWHMGGDGPVFGMHANGNGDDGNIGVPHLRAICRYGANLADEWAAIRTVLEFSKTYSQSKSNKSSLLAIECWDVQDGQMLLIESANVLPSWVDHVGPEACRHRCWIRNGLIHLIAPAAVGGGDEIEEGAASLLLSEALGVLAEGNATASKGRIETPDAVQTVIQDCIARFLPGNDDLTMPPKSSSTTSISHHKAVLVVPRSAACLIQERPDLVNAAIVAFANRALHPPPTNSNSPKSKQSSNTNTSNNIVGEDWVWTTHSFGRTNYAMLRTIVSPTWKTESHIPKDYQSVELRRAQRQAAVEAMPHLRHAVQVGVRLVVGLNTILQQKQQQSAVIEPSLSSLSLQERRILHYWPRLLQQELNSSAQWLIDAWRAGPNHSPHNLENILLCPVILEEMELHPEHITALSHPDTSLYDQIHSGLRKADSAEHTFILPRQDEVDANEDWMMLSSDTVDAQMESMSGRKREKVKIFSSTKKSREQHDKEQAAQLDTMLDGFETFMVDKSDVEGVSHKQPQPNANKSSNETKNDMPLDSNDSNKRGVSVNPRVFLHLLKTVLDPSTPPEAIQFPDAGDTTDDDFFSRDDYEALLPDDEDDDDDNLPVDTGVMELMAAMDNELKGTSALSGSGDQVEILTNLLQSLDAGAGGPGPVQSMMKAMGEEPPLVSSGIASDDDDDAEEAS